MAEKFPFVFYNFYLISTLEVPAQILSWNVLSLISISPDQTDSRIGVLLLGFDALESSHNGARIARIGCFKQLCIVLLFL